MVCCKPALALLSYVLYAAFERPLTMNTRWINRKDHEGHNVFEGGFLGLDKIGAFD